MTHEERVAELKLLAGHGPSGPVFGLHERFGETRFYAWLPSNPRNPSKLEWHYFDGNAGEWVGTGSCLTVPWPQAFPAKEMQQ